MTRISKVLYTDKGARVFLDDGSELEGLIEVISSSAVNELSTVNLKAYMFTTKLYQYVNRQSGELVSPTAEQADRFFDNRHPLDWERCE